MFQPSHHDPIGPLPPWTQPLLRAAAVLDTLPPWTRPPRRAAGVVLALAMAITGWCVALVLIGHVQRSTEETIDSLDIDGLHNLLSQWDVAAFVLFPLAVVGSAYLSSTRARVTAERIARTEMRREDDARACETSAARDALRCELSSAGTYLARYCDETTTNWVSPSSARSDSKDFVLAASLSAELAARLERCHSDLRWIEARVPGRCYSQLTRDEADIIHDLQVKIAKAEDALKNHPAPERVLFPDFW